MPADARKTAGETRRLDLEAAVFLEVGANGGHSFVQTDARVATLAHEF